MVGMPALSSTALCITLSLHEMARMRTSQAAHMETAESPLLPGAQGPGFAADRRRVLTTQALYTCIFACSENLLFVQTLFVSLDSVVATFPIVS